MTKASLLMSYTGVFFLIIAMQSPVSADSPIRIKTTRTTSGTTRDLSTTRLRVTTTATPTRISSIKEVTAKSSPSEIQKVKLQDNGSKTTTPDEGEDNDSFLPITEVEVEQNSLQQPAPRPTTALGKQNNNLIIEAPAPTQPSKTTTAGPLQIQESAGAKSTPPAFLIGQDTTGESQTDEVPQNADELPAPQLPQQGVVDPLAGAGGAAIQIAPMLDPKNCGTPDCEKAATLISAKPLSEISLDISPSFKPNLDQKPPKLQQEVRQWRNRSGQVLAEGQLADYAYSSVHIKGSNGELTALPIIELSIDDVCYIADAWGFPKQCRIDNSPYEQRAWESLDFHWRASAVAHKPVYFEDAQLERHGHTLGPWLQPMRSGAHFFTNIAILPYHMGIHPWNECQYTLGYHRPGSIAPRVKPAFPISKKAALIQAGSVLGGVFIIP